MKTVTDMRAAEPSDLGPDATAVDVVAYNEALERAWPRGHAEVYDDYAEILATEVLEGRRGLDEQGRDWVQVANARRAEVSR